MHRVELKEMAVILQIEINIRFLMHRVELKVKSDKLNA